MSNPPDLRYASSTLARSLMPALLGLGVGAVSAYSALGLVALIQWAQPLSLGITGTQVYSQAAQVPALRILLAPCLGGGHGGTGGATLSTAARPRR